MVCQTMQFSHGKNKWHLLTFQVKIYCILACTVVFCVQHYNMGVSLEVILYSTTHVSPHVSSHMSVTSYLAVPVPPDISIHYLIQEFINTEYTTRNAVK